jgi:hypothetical protein
LAAKAPVTIRPESTKPARTKTLISLFFISSGSSFFWFLDDMNDFGK